MNHAAKFETLPDDGATRYIIIACSPDKNPESYGMYRGYYFNGNFQWAAQKHVAFRTLADRIKTYPEYDWEIYELLPDRRGA